jgi:deoxyribodipyrimidine photo-lyase
MMTHGDFSAFHQYRIQESLTDLKNNLGQYNIPLLIRHGEMIDILTQINSILPITTIHAHEETGNGKTFARDRAVIKRTKHHTIPFQETPTNGVVRRLVSRDDRAKIWDERIVKKPIIPPPPVQSGQ